MPKPWLLWGQVGWQFAARRHDTRERVALRITSCSFFALSLIVGHDAVSGLVNGHAAEHSSAGIAIAASSLVVMPVVSWLQRQAGRHLGSDSAVADARQALLCTYMSTALLLGLVAHDLLGWWWADPAAGLAIAALAVREGIGAWNGDTCCSPAAALFEHHDAHGCHDARPSAQRCCDGGARILGRSASAAPLIARGREGGATSLILQRTCSDARPARCAGGDDRLTC